MSAVLPQDNGAWQLSRLLQKSALLDSLHKIDCVRRVALASASYHPARHPQRVLIESSLPACNCGLEAP